MTERLFIAFEIARERPDSRELLVKNGVDGTYQCFKWVREDEGIRMTEAEIAELRAMRTCDHFRDHGGFCVCPCHDKKQ